ncbi:hypothetical protein PUR29_34360 [Methylobacterium ajmalii]|uniref:Uncharacterized protein n=1 Tax=Methylobacterium ajmalii TaxID=2738439 RepID=A0ABV0A711_9HYPH
MTTIVYRAGLIVGDTCITQGNSRVGRVTKVVRRKDGALAGACGELGALTSFLGWAETESLKKKAKPFLFCDSGEGFIAHPDGRIQWYGGEGTAFLDVPHIAIGSGSLVAMGAMFMGASARDAMVAAASIDHGTAGPFVCLTHDSKVVETFS